MISRSKTTTDFGLTRRSIYQPVKSLDKMQNSIITDTVDTVRTTLTALSPMKSVRFHGPGDIRVDEINEPECGKDEVKVLFKSHSCFLVMHVTDLDKIRPAFVGICGSGMLNIPLSVLESKLMNEIDLHEYTGGPVLIPNKPHKITGSMLPVTLGHEFSGIVEEVGEDVTHISPGQRVVVRPTIFDRTCTRCRMGLEYCCENIGFIGLSGYGGGMAEHTTAPASHFYAIPDSVSLEAAALIEPLAVSWHAVNRSPFKVNDNVLVIGGGPIGIGIIQVLKLQGAGNIIVTEMAEKRRQFSKHYGASYTLNPRVDNVTQRVLEITDGVGADVVFDTAGVEIALKGGIEACRAHGSVVNIAVWEKPPAVPVNTLMYREAQYIGVTLYDELSFVDVIRALCYGQLHPEGMITDKIKLEDVVEKGFKTLLGEKREEHCKILVDMLS